MNGDKFNVGSDRVNISLIGNPTADGFDWTLSAVNADKLSREDWKDVTGYIQSLERGEKYD